VAKANCFKHSFLVRCLVSEKDWIADGNYGEAVYMKVKLEKIAGFGRNLPKERRNRIAEKFQSLPA
jgi:hypothetical protein